MKKIFLIVGAIVISFVGYLFFVNGKDNFLGDSEKSLITQKTSGVLENKKEDSLLSEKETILLFWQQIDEDKIVEAVDLLSESMASNESAKQSWAVQFNGFEEVIVKDIFSQDNNTFKVILETKMKPEAATAGPIPYFGYGEGEFTRWIKLTLEDNHWKIAEIATGY